MSDMDRSPGDEDRVRDEIVAYLDGELDTEASRRVEDRLAQDPDYRSQLGGLERAWDCLDALPRATVDETFARTTVQMVTVAAEGDVQRHRSSLATRLRPRSLVTGSALVAATLVGFLAVAVLRPNLDRQLLRDLPVVEKLELYLEFDNVEFLRQLHKQRIFANEVEDGAS